ncbi:hypothetical protein BH11ACT3_BH11ACT3_05700 [soil metagenome]
MDVVPLILLVALILGAAIAMLAFPSYLRRHPDQRGASSATGGLVGSVDDVFHPEGAAAALALDEEQRLVQPIPTPDGDKGIADGRIRIDLS